MNTENHTFNTLFRQDMNFNKYLLAYSINHFFEIAMAFDIDLVNFDKYLEEFENFARSQGYKEALPGIIECFTLNFHRLWLRQIAGKETTERDIALTDDIFNALELGCIECLIEKQMIQ
ncbi:MAG: hypothetical protein KZQ83_15045 [gamma proteobacterium symbiont of Taylorina sp.]|nr:hypothetical protein [gamma proteobacterium symbiont of Taylorina sp.]